MALKCASILVMIITTSSKVNISHDDARDLRTFIIFVMAAFCISFCEEVMKDFGKISRHHCKFWVERRKWYNLQQTNKQNSAMILVYNLGFDCVTIWKPVQRCKTPQCWTVIKVLKMGAAKPASEPQQKHCKFELFQYLFLAFYITFWHWESLVID